jgi:hypothetical protein
MNETWVPEVGAWEQAIVLVERAIKDGTAAERVHAHGPDGSCRDTANHHKCVTYRVADRLVPQ